MMTASKLRENIYQVLDRVIHTGVPVEINRKGKILKIIPPNGKKRLTRLKKHNVINGKPESVVHIDWSGEWKA